jgi:hypothetical protein
MCAGDTALEKSLRGPDGVIVADVDGWGVQHECRDFGPIIEWARERRSFDRSGILRTEKVD